MKLESLRKLRGPILVAALATCIGAGMAQNSGADIWSVKVRYTSEAQLKQLTDMLDHP